MCNEIMTIAMMVMMMMMNRKLNVHSKRITFVVLVYKIEFFNSSDIFRFYDEK